MPSNGNIVKFAYLPYNTFAAMTKDEDQIYYTSDTAQMFVGSQEYTRPVMYGSSIPDTLLPPNSLFYNETDLSLYLSKDGAEWTPVSNFYIHPDANTETEEDTEALKFGGSFTAETVELDEQGHVVKTTTMTYTLPTISSDGSTGDGNAVTDISTDEDGNIVITKGDTFVTEETFEEAISKITSFEVDAGPDGTGYESIYQLVELHPEGEAGVIYLVKGSEGHEEETNVFSEYLWIKETESYEMFGTFGDVDLTSYVKTSTTINGHELTGDITLTAEDLGLGDVDDTPDDEKNVASAEKLTNPVAVELTGDATGKVDEWDGSTDLTIETTVNHAASADTDSEGNNIAETYLTQEDAADTYLTQEDAADTYLTQEAAEETYATKEDVEDNTVVWEVYD